jgi:hypothetical protein
VCANVPRTRIRAIRGAAKAAGNIEHVTLLRSAQPWVANEGLDDSLGGCRKWIPQFTNLGRHAEL